MYQFKKLALAAVLVASVGSASASVTTLTDTNLTSFVDQIIFSGSEVNTGAFTDTFDFGVSLNGNLSGKILAFSFGNANAISDLKASIFALGGSTPIFTYENAVLGTTPITSGFYTLKITGFATGTGSVTGSYQGGLTLDPAAAVPEPETYAMFLAGLGIMGALARRRKQA